MRVFRRTSQNSAMTLVEVLVVAFVICILWSMILPMRSGPRHAYNTTCVSNLRQSSLGFQQWASDHGSKYPWQVSTNNGGSLEFDSGPNAFRHFALQEPFWRSSSEYALGLFVCPTDKRKSALDFASFGNSNLSYFVNLNAVSNPAKMILSGDRFITSNVPVRSQVLSLTLNSLAGWSGGHKGPHGFRGCISFTDGHVEFSQSPLQTKLVSSDVITSRLLLP